MPFILAGNSIIGRGHSEVSTLEIASDAVRHFGQTSRLYGLPIVTLAMTCSPGTSFLTIAEREVLPIL